MEHGLSQTLAQPQQQQAVGDSEALLQQVVELLLQGIDPKVILEKGVPMEVIKQAMQIVMQQQASQQPSGQEAPQTDAGMAAISSEGM